MVDSPTLVKPTMTQAPPLTTLDSLPSGARATVIHLAPGNTQLGDVGTDVSRRLMELGFVPGERIRILRRGMLGGGPLAVKVGQSTFALRHAEAALVSVQPE